jgi:hypothetical protein
MQGVILLSVILLRFIYSECSYTACNYAECHHAECRGTISLRLLHLNHFWSLDKKKFFFLGQNILKYEIQKEQQIPPEQYHKAFCFNS